MNTCPVCGKDVADLWHHLGRAHRAKSGRAHKYSARRTQVGNLTFDSKHEAARWGELLLLEAAGRISGLRRQVSYKLKVRGQLVCTFRPDHVYYDVTRRVKVIEDAKGVKTQVFRLKAKLFKALTGREVRCV